MGTRCHSELNYHKNKCSPTQTGHPVNDEDDDGGRDGRRGGGGGKGGREDDKTSLVTHSNRSLGNSPIRWRIPLYGTNTTHAVDGHFGMILWGIPLPDPIKLCVSTTRYGCMIRSFTLVWWVTMGLLWVAHWPWGIAYLSAPSKIGPHISDTRNPKQIP